MIQKKNKIQEQEIHLRDYYLVLLKHRFLILTCLVLTVAVTLFFTLQMEPIYSSTTTLVIERPQTISSLTGKRLEYVSYFSQNLTFNTHFKLITSRPVLERVARELKLDQSENSDKLSPGPVRAFVRQTRKNIRQLLGRQSIPPTAEEKHAQLIGSLLGRIEIKEVMDTRLLQIIVEDTDPVMAGDIANSLARSYIQFNITNSMQASQTSFQTMQDQSYELKKKLEDAEQDFLKFKQDEQLFSITGKQETINQRISEFSELSVKNRNELQELTARLTELETLIAKKIDVVRIRSLLNNPVIDKLNEQLIEAKIELSKLRKVYRDIHPRVAKVIGTIEDTERTIIDQVTRELANMKNRQALLLAKEKDLQKNNADLEQESLDLGQKEVRYAILQRNVETNQKLYDTLLEKLSESDINESLSSESIRIAEIGQVPLAPIKPSKKLNVLLSIVLGLLGGIGLAFFLEYLDQTIRTEDDVQRYLDLPVLAVVPIAGQSGTGYGSRARKVPKAKKIKA